MEYFSLRKFPKGLRYQLHKICFVMRLTIFLLLAAIFQVNAKTEAQTITLKGTNVRLEKALSEIENQSNYAFFWKDQLIHSAPRVNIHFKNYLINSIT